MPTRYLKPGICDSDSIDKCTPLAECLFYRLLVNVDDFGRLDARPAVIRSRCFPLKDTLTNKDTDNLLLELRDCGLIILYKINGCIYLQLDKWDNIPRAKESKCPSHHDEGSQAHTTVCNGNTVLPVTVTVTVTETVKPKHKPEPKTGVNAIAIPDWIPTETWLEFVESRKANKKPLTPGAIKLAIITLKGLKDSGNDPRLVLEQSILSGYSGLFPINKGKQSIADQNRAVGEEFKLKLRQQNQQPQGETYEHN